MIQQDKCKSISKALMIIIIICSILPIIAISYYNHPSADDYGYSKNVHAIYENDGTVADIIKGAYDTSMEYMQKWQGLYSAAFLWLFSLQHLAKGSMELQLLLSW